MQFLKIVQRSNDLMTMSNEELELESKEANKAMAEAIDKEWMPKATAQKPDTLMANHIRNFNKAIKREIFKALDRQGITLSPKEEKDYYHHLPFDLKVLSIILHEEAWRFVRASVQKPDFDYKALNRDFSKLTMTLFNLFFTNEAA